MGPGSAPEQAVTRAAEGRGEGRKGGKKTAPSGIKCGMDRAGLGGKGAEEGDTCLLKLSLQHTQAAKSRSEDAIQ